MNINTNSINLFQNTSINKIRKSSKITDNSNKQEDKNNLKVTIKQNDKQSSLMENLLKQKQFFVEQKQSLMNTKMDPKEKKSKLEEINENITQIESQIQQLTIQEKQEEIEKQQEQLEKKKADEEKYNKNGDEVRDDIIISASLNELIKLNSSKENIHLLKDSKNRQKVEAQYIKPNDNPNSYNNKRLSQIHKSISNLDMTINKKIRDINESAAKIKYKTELAIEKLKNKEDKEAKDKNNEKIKEKSTEN